MRHKSWSSRPGDLTIRGPLQTASLGQRPAKGLSRRQAQRPQLEGRRYLPRRRVLTLHKKFCVFTIFIVVDLGSTCDICLGCAADLQRSGPPEPILNRPVSTAWRLVMSTATPLASICTHKNPGRRAHRA
jgi:hypothetical protein